MVKYSSQNFAKYTPNAYAKKNELQLLDINKSRQNPN